MATTTPEGVRRIETVDEAKAVVEAYFEAWPKTRDPDNGNEIATYQKATVEVEPNEVAPKKQLIFFEIIKGREKERKGSTTTMRRRRVSFGVAFSGVVEKVGNTVNYSDDPKNPLKANQADFIEVINAFRDEIEGVKGATEGSANSDESLPEVEVFQDKLAHVIPGDDDDSDGVPTPVLE